MSINRFLSRRDKQKHIPDEVNFQSLKAEYFFHNLFVDKENVIKPREKHKSHQLKDVKSLLAIRKLDGFTDEDIQYALSLPFTNGSVEKTVELIKLVQDSERLILHPYSLRIKYLGAVNRDAVTCYLDSLFFAMFAYSDSFEMMLSKKFDDPWKTRLATLIRLWVNAQRSGHLVTTDITKQIQEALATCGWTDAGEKRQQDVLEAYSFILEQLGFPDLHLRMDIFHSGKEEADDDHKIVRERVLTMPIPEPRKDGVPIKLEDCFELALIARIDVRRRYEVRRATNSSTRPLQFIDFNKSQGMHVESVEVSGSETPTPVTDIPPSHSFPHSADQPRVIMHRAPSLIQDKLVFDKELFPDNRNDIEETTAGSESRARAGSMRKEVMMPAWQMYSLIPFHTDCEPSNDAEVAEHITSNEPVFCIALKRYGFGADGVATRRDDYVDIPLDMALPHFIHENCLDEINSSFERFKISLRSLVCHRGKSVASGHYISLVRIASAIGEDKWALNDDLAGERVREVDIHECLRKETPYLLFYQLQPLKVPILSGMESRSPSNSGTKDSGTEGIPSMSLDMEMSSSEKFNSERPSFEAVSFKGSELEKIWNSNQRPPSITLADNILITNDRVAPSVDIPLDSLTTRTGDIPSRSNSRMVRANLRSSPVSQGGSKRSSLSISRLTDMLSSRTDLDASKSDEAFVDTQTAPSKQASPNMADAVAEAYSKGRMKKKDKNKKNEDRRRGRLGAPGHFGKVGRDEKRPDRECSIM